MEGDRVEDHTACILFCIEQFRLRGILGVMEEGGRRGGGGDGGEGGRGDGGEGGGNGGGEREG